jgi:DHA2 family multidrug resistance protein
MFCLLPPTRLALGRLPAALVADASGVFNLMRNLGGAIGLALIDTVIFARAPVHAAALIDKLRGGDLATALSLGIPKALFLAQAGHAPSPIVMKILRPLVEKAALAAAINDAWALIAALTLAALVLLPWVRKSAGSAEDV